MKSIPIKQIRRRYKRQGLLMTIDKTDEATTTPLTGRLIAHNPRRYESDRASIKYPKPALVVFSEDDFPRLEASVFSLLDRFPYQ